MKNENEKFIKGKNTSSKNFMQLSLMKGIGVLIQPFSNYVEKFKMLKLYSDYLKHGIKTNTEIQRL